MICARHGRLSILGLVIALCAGTVLVRVSATNQTNQQETVVTVRWGARPGVARYRLQLANDQNFTDIVFDRVVNGHEYRVSDLLPGRYFWRVASLDGRLGDFSSAGVIEVAANATAIPSPLPSQSPITNIEPSAVATRGGWYAAIPNISKPIPAHLRTATSADIVANTVDGRVVALNALNGVVLWFRRANVRPTGSLLLLPLRSRGGRENVLVFSGSSASVLEGTTGRELWRTNLSAAASSAVASATAVFVIDSSLQKLIVIDGNTGKLLSNVQLERRAAGAPVIDYRSNSRSVMVALEDGRLQVFDETGKLIRMGDAAGAATTGPLIVRTSRGNFVLVGTQNALTALSADDLRPLGRVTLRDDTPRGTLFAQDLDGDGTPEVTIFTERGRVVVVKSDEGKILWESDARRADAAAFADVNGDHVLDLVMAGREGFAFALSGRDGTLLWKDESPAGVVTNHASGGAQRSPLVVTSSPHVLFIAADPARGGLRAVEFTKAGAARN